MNALTDTKDVSLIGRVPEGGGMAKVGLRGEQKRERDISWGWGGADKERGFIVFGYLGTKLTGGGFCGAL